MEELNGRDVELLPYPLQRLLVKSLSMVAEKAGKPEFFPLWAGQSVGLLREHDSKIFLQNLISEISSVASPIVDWNRERRWKSKKLD